MPDGPDSERVPRLVAGSDAESLVSSPAEGFLLSRIDGVTPWRMLREIAGLDPADVDVCLERWISDGAVTCEVERKPAHRRAKRLAPGQIDEDLIDESIDLDVDIQRRILEFESGLGRPDREILGIPADSNVKVIKRAYFKLSKEFHPDRYFRREIGEYSERLHRIFKRILDVYELLSDPELRAEVEKSKSMEAAAGGAPVSKPGPAETPTAPPRELTPLERLRVRMPIKLPASVLIERKQHAEDFYRSSCKAESSGTFTEAATLRRLAIAFDPFNDDYRSGFAEISAGSAQQRAERLLSEAEDADGPARAGANVHKEALRLYEEALLYRPHDPDLNQRAALSAIEVDQVAKAFEYAETAVEHSPELGSCHRTLARVFEVRGDRGHALHELEKAAKLDPHDRETRSLMAKLRRLGN
jgi:curved DNA-binding protein CbpA